MEKNNHEKGTLATIINSFDSGVCTALTFFAFGEMVESFNNENFQPGLVYLGAGIGAGYLTIKNLYRVYKSLDDGS